MESLIAHPENKEQLAALKLVLKVLKITFEKNEKTYDPALVEKIIKEKAQIGQGETRVININSL